MRFEEAVKMMDEKYKRSGFSGIVAAGDAETDWIFQTKKKKKHDLPPPVMVNKETGNDRFWNIAMDGMDVFVTAKPLDFEKYLQEK